MPTFRPFDVVAVPFPYVEREARKRRPTVVVSRPDVADRHGLAWVLMITSADNPAWPGDVGIDDLAAAGLPKPSVIRPAKIATVETARCDLLGRLSGKTARAVAAAVARAIAPAVP
jgi:mRNA interferase MazF